MQSIHQGKANQLRSENYAGRLWPNADTPEKKPRRSGGCSYRLACDACARSDRARRRPRPVARSGAQQSQRMTQAAKGRQGPPDQSHLPGLSRAARPHFFPAYDFGTLQNASLQTVTPLTCPETSDRPKTLFPQRGPFMSEQTEHHQYPSRCIDAPSRFYDCRLQLTSSIHATAGRSNVLLAVQILNLGER